MKLLKIEILKLKNSKVILSLIILPILSILYGSINYVNNIEVLKSEWISLWTQVYLFYGSMFYPTLIGIICAYIWNNEYKNDGMKVLLSSSHSFKEIVINKMVLTFIIILIQQIYFLLLFYISGSLLRLNMKFPISVIGWALIITAFSVIYIVIQSYLSLRIKSFAIPIGLSLIFGLGTYILVAQNKFAEVKYIFAASNMSLEMNNNFTEIYYYPIEWIKMIIYTGIILYIGVYLQVKYLKKLVD